MAKCCGGTGSCACAVEAGRNMQVSGTGSPNDPLVISSDIVLSVADTEDFDLGLVGQGTLESPWVLTANWSSTAGLDGIPDVFVPNPTNGYVLAWDSSFSRWRAVPATTASAGSVLTDGSLSGDGSTGSPLQVRENTSRYMETTAAGLGLSDLGVNRTVRYFADAAARTGTTVAPEFGTLSMLGENPGVIQYWTGSVWANIVPGSTVPTMSVQATALLAVSGAYTGTRTTQWVGTVENVTTGADGSFSVVPTAALTGYAGVLDVHVQPVGTTPWTCMVTGDVNRIKGVAWNTTTGTVRASTPVSARVTAVLY